ncbi:hypothetical protein, partial [Novosphingobium rosa]|uniref:hypothetical protein n=1 Tax=Novosphingobium rosa TaxID=76978 RepID=UPI000836A54C
MRLKSSLSLAAALLAAPMVHAQPAAQPLQFEVKEGKNLNSFYRQGPVAAHMLLRSGTDPRILVAFPAGNSGVGLWFDHLDQAATWRMVTPPAAQTVEDAKGRKLHGITATAEITVPALQVKQAILSSVRVLRDYQSDGIKTPEVETVPGINGQTILWQRDRLDGAPGYRLAVTVVHGSLALGRITAGADGKITLRIEAQSGETPLTPLQGNALLSARANRDPAARNTLSFLSYREKFMAGSWRFNTYFGRDTMMSLSLLMPALQPEAIEGGLRSVIARLSPQGEAAHEEGIGEFAVLDHLRHHQPLTDAPEYDYAMIDSSYMLAPLVERALLGSPAGMARARAFLAAPSGKAGDRQETAGAALMRNLRYVLTTTQPFAQNPSVAHLLAIKDGRTTGEWRDSNDGLGLGRYPYDVNAALAPAALRAIQGLTASGVLTPYMTPQDKAAFARAGAAADIWASKAPTFFDVTVPAAQAKADITTYAAALNVPAQAALKAVDAQPVRFHALSLNADGSPVRVVNSDPGFTLMFGQPAPALLDRDVAAMMRPFPAGLLTDVGLLVANPIYGTPEDKSRFTQSAYHGLVVWSWQQALLAAGLDRQLKRRDLPIPVRTHLLSARTALWKRIEAHRDMASSELWSWALENGHYKVVAFGAGAGDADESNAAQLWSSAYLGLAPVH